MFVRLNQARIEITMNLDCVVDIYKSINTFTFCQKLSVVLALDSRLSVSFLSRNNTPVHLCYMYTGIERSSVLYYITFPYLISTVVTTHITNTRQPTWTASVRTATNWRNSTTPASTTGLPINFCEAVQTIPLVLRSLKSISNVLR